MTIRVFGEFGLESEENFMDLEEKISIRKLKLEDYEDVDTLMQQLHRIHVDARPDLYAEMEHPYSRGFGSR